MRAEIFKMARRFQCAPHAVSPTQHTALCAFCFECESSKSIPRKYNGDNTVVAMTRKRKNADECEENADKKMRLNTTFLKIENGTF